MVGNLDVDSKLSIVIPAYNERDGLLVTLDNLLEELPEAEILVIDDASTDGTADGNADYTNVIWLQHDFNRGYGGALKTGVRAATREFVAWFDADNEHRASDLRRLLEHIIARKVVAVIAQRDRAGPSPVRAWGKRVIRLLARTFDVHVGSDINCGLRVFRRKIILRYLPLLPNGYSASITSTMIMLERGYPIEFVPVSLNPRIGMSKVTIGDGFFALIVVLRTIMLFAPLRIFLRAGLALGIIGIIYGLITAVIQGQGIPAASVLAVITGVMMIFFGLIADQISQMRLATYDVSTFKVIRHPDPEFRAEELEIPNAMHDAISEPVESKSR